MGQAHSDMLCLDVFNNCIAYVYYKERPKMLCINKHIHSLYNHTYIKKDKQTYLNLKCILNASKFFNILLDENYKEFINKQNEYIVNLLYSFAFTQREVINSPFDDYVFIVVPLRCASEFYISQYMCNYVANEFSRNQMSVIRLAKNKYDYTNASFVDIFGEYNIWIENGFEDNFGNYIFLDVPQGMIPIGPHFQFITNNLCYSDYTGEKISNKAKLCMVVEDSCTEKMQPEEYNQLLWYMLNKATKDQVIVNTLQFLKGHTFENKVEIYTY
jgi:hypothetical protein